MSKNKKKKQAVERRLMVRPEGRVVRRSKRLDIHWVIRS